MYQLLFVIHGMGAGERPATDQSWWTEVIDGLKGKASAFAHKADLVSKSPKTGQVLIVPLTYHDILDQLRAKWKQQSPNEAGWIPLLTQLVPEFEADVPGWVDKAGDFFWTHVLDVLMYRFVPEFTVQIREQIALQIATAWHKADIENGARTAVHFVAHSLGTAVLHDSICILAKEAGFGAGSHRIRSIVTLANVSSVLEMDNQAYHSVDRPLLSAPPPKGMTETYVCCRHELDPIAAVKAFRGDLNGWSPDGYIDDVLVDVKAWNVHGFMHYLNNPDAYLRLFERMWPTEPWGDRWDAAVAEYRKEPGAACPAAIAQLRLDLREILRQPRPDTVPGFVDAVSRTIRALAEAKAACSEEQ